MSLWLTDNHWLPCLSSLLNGSLLKARVLSDSNLCFLFSAQESKQNRFYWTFSTLKSHQFSHSVVSDSLRPYEPQHARLPCTAPTPGAYSNSCPLNGDAIQPSQPLQFPSSPAIFPSIRVFSNESVLCIRWPKYWRFSFSISPSNEYSGLTSFRIDWLDHLAVQRTLKSLLQHPQFKTSILQHLAFFTVQLTSIHDHWKNHTFD